MQPVSPAQTPEVPTSISPRNAAPHCKHAAAVSSPAMLENQPQTVSNLRATLRGRAFKGEARSSSAQKQKQDGVAEATVAVGLKLKELTPQERQLFGSRSTSYLRARGKILLKWYQDCKHAVNLREILDNVDDNSISVTKDAYYFLQENGYINFGVVQESKPAAEPEAAAAAAGGDGQQQQQDEPVEESEAAIVFKLYELLRAADMETTSEKALRKELQKHFKTDINEKKALVKEHVNYFIQHLNHKDTLEPKGYEGVPDPYEAAAARKAKAEKAAAAKAAAKAKRDAAAVPPAKPVGRVVVVGAGPTGLAAATVLQRNNVDVMVLEARERVGGRVHSYQGDFAAPVDLGASLVIGTAPDTSDGRAPDPVSFICKQLDLKLHELQQELPIYDAAGSKVSEELDKNVDRLRDALLDDTEEFEEHDGADDMSLGQALQQALVQRLKAAAATAAKAAPHGGAAATANGEGPQQQSGAAVEQQRQESEQPAANGTEQQQEQDVQSKHQQQEQAASQSISPRKQLPPGLEPKSEADKQQSFAELVAAAAAGTTPITQEMLELLDWHWANLEYGCSASLDKVSLPNWNQDEEWGGFGGPHAMVVGGFDQALHGLAKQLGDKLHLSSPVAKIEYGDDDQQQQPGQDEEQKGSAEGSAEQQQQQQTSPEGQSSAVRVTTASGEVYECSAVLVTVPLGVLKAGNVEFVPPLPEWKATAIQKLGFGDLNKVVLQFAEVFWEDVDYFGITQPAGPDTRGRCFMFWNLAQITGAPLLTALVSGRAAQTAEHTSQSNMVQHTLQALRRVFGESVSEPVASYATKWGSDEFSRGSYSYVAASCDGAEYDTLAAPVARRVLFAGEHTCKEHPDTVGGAMLSGMREAARALHVLRGTDSTLDDLVTSRTATLSRTDKKRKRREEEEEEYEALSESAEEAEAEMKPKQRVKKEKKERKPRDKGEATKGAVGKKRRKSKAGSDAEVSGDEAVKPGGRGGRHAAGLTPGEMQNRLQTQREMADSLGRLWKGFIDAQAGDVHTVMDVLNSCASLDDRQRCMAAVMRAPAETLHHLSESPKFLEVIRSWLAELLPERSDANLHVTKKTIELMAKLTSSWAALEAVPGMMDTVKAASEHRNKEVAQLGAALRKDWLSRNPNKPPQSAQRRPPSAGTAAQRGTNISNLLQPQQQKTQQRAKSAATAAAADASAAAAAGKPASDAAEVSELVDADKLQELEAIQAQLQAAKEQVSVLC
eukprot:GHUV01020904.1.p1 GENE.GHUV01020904.1~~GHUV01020904.1.p1  ORF type:complete len:1234 (+),score=527.47 GHUV01020904.1:96-3797(+)